MISFIGSLCSLLHRALSENVNLLNKYSLQHSLIIWKNDKFYDIYTPQSDPRYSDNFDWEDTWQNRTFGDADWKNQNLKCFHGTTCKSINMAPSARYLQSSIAYTSWNFELDVKPHATLCRLFRSQENNCDSSCLEDTTCMKPDNFVGWFR